MKKQIFLAFTLTAALTLGNLFGGITEVSAATNNPVTLITADKNCEDPLSEELLQNKILTEKELKQYHQAVENIMRLYDQLEGKEITDALLEKLEKKETKIYEANKEIFDKVTEYFQSFEPVTYPISEDFYEELFTSGTLNKDELKLYKEAEEKIDALYKNATENDFTDEGFAKFLEKEEFIYQTYKEIFDKVERYCEKLQENYDHDMINQGKLSPEYVIAY